jgi:hypothetical protein
MEVEEETMASTETLASTEIQVNQETLVSPAGPAHLQGGPSISTSRK